MSRAIATCLWMREMEGGGDFLRILPNTPHRENDCWVRFEFERFNSCL